jgi:lipoprotein-anchoring transpeptidase ErfK/SrfK
MGATRRIRIALVGLTAAATVAGLTSCGGDATHRTAATPAVHVVGNDPADRPAHIQTLAVALPAAVSTVSMLSPSQAVIAAVEQRIAVYGSPGGSVVRHLTAWTPFGSLRRVLVTARYGDRWLQIELPARPNGSRGWIRRSSVRLMTTPMRIVVSRKHRTLTLLRAGTAVARYPVAVGASATPTPTGLFYVTDKLVTGAPSGAYGPYALGLSGYSNVLYSFAGGDGVVGIHGTNADWSVGKAVTHGCIRLHNRDIPKLYRAIWAGTPVVIH